MEYLYSSALAICGVVLIPVLFWWYRQPMTSSLKWFGFFVITFFGHGSIELLQIVPNTILRYAFELPMLFLYFKTITSSGYVISYPGRALIPIFLIVSLISAIPQTSLIMYVLFILYVLEIFMMWLYFRNRFDADETELVHRLFVYLAISQIFTAFIKYAMVGVYEPYIGSMASHEGGITTLFSLCAFCVSLEMYFVTHKKKCIWLMAGFAIFGMVGGKRALVFLLPIFYFVTLLVHSYYTKTLSANIKKIVIGAITMPALFVVMCILNPSFNPEEQVGGTFDLDYVLEYSDKYNNGGFGGDDEAGRAQAHEIVHAKILSSDIYNILFGYGAGSFIASGFNTADVSSEAKMERFGVGYSMDIGYLYMLVQVGFLGVFCYFCIFLALLIGLSKKIKRARWVLSDIEMGWCVSAVIILMCVCLLSAVYNTASFYFNCGTMLIMWLLTYADKILSRNKIV